MLLLLLLEIGRLWTELSVGKSSEWLLWPWISGLLGLGWIGMVILLRKLRRVVGCRLPWMVCLLVWVVLLWRLLLWGLTRQLLLPTLLHRGRIKGQQIHFGFRWLLGLLLIVLISCLRLH